MQLSLSLYSAVIITFLAMRKDIFRILFVIGTCPLTNALQNRYNRQSFFSKGIFHSGRNFIVGLPVYHSVFYQCFQRRAKNCIRDIGKFSAQFTIPQSFFCCKHTDNSRIPFASEYIQPIFQRAADISHIFSASSFFTFSFNIFITSGIIFCIEIHI